jgi:hypothetical protein
LRHVTQDQADRIEAKLDQLLEAVHLLLLAEVADEDEPDDGFPADMPMSS